MRMLSPFVDLRLKKNGELFFKRMIERKTIIIKQMGRGLKRFHEMFDGWNLYRDLSTG